MNRVCEKALYPLIPSQKTMVYMLKYSLHKQVINVPTSLSVARSIDFSLLGKALYREIERNDCMRIRFVKSHGALFQYFTAAPEPVQIPVLHFDTPEAQEAAFNADASKPLDFLRGETFRVRFFTSHDGKCGVYLNVSHLIMDAVATGVFYRDLFAVYDALEKHTPMPTPLASFEAHLQKEYDYLNSPKYQKDHDFLEDFHRRMASPPYYAGVHGPDLLNRQRKLFHKPDLTVPIAFDPIRDRARTFRTQTDAQTTRSLLSFCQRSGVSPEVLLQTGFKLYAAHLNGRAEDTMLMALCSRRFTEDEKNMGGCLTQPVQMRTKMPRGMTFEALLRESTHLRMALFRHSNFPYLDALELERKMYHFNRAQGPALMMYTWLPISELGDSFSEEIEYRGYALDRYIMPLYTFTFKIPNQDSIRFYYLYRTNTITGAQIEALHEGCLRALSIGIAQPDITLDALYNELDR